MESICNHKSNDFCQLHNPWPIREDLKELAGKNYIVRFMGTMITINMQFRRNNLQFKLTVAMDKGKKYIRDKPSK
jgi:hypothetical protein